MIVACVPWPGAELNCRLPPIRSNRSRMLNSPKPPEWLRALSRSGSHPTPLSATSSLTCFSSTCDRRMATWVA